MHKGEDAYPGERLYAVTDKKSEVYIINTTDWSATKFNETVSEYGYKDIARADNLDVNTPRSFLAAAGDKIVLRSVYSHNSFGEQGVINYTSDGTELVGVTYLRSDMAGYSYRYDEFAILDSKGNLYHDTFTESYDKNPLMAVAGQKSLYVSSGVYVNPKAYNSLYNDGEYVYWVRCKADGSYELDAFDLTRGTYKTVGTFPDGMEITGLFRLNTKEGKVSASGASAGETSVTDGAAVTGEITRMAPVFTTASVLAADLPEAAEDSTATLPSGCGAVHERQVCCHLQCQ